MAKPTEDQAVKPEFHPLPLNRRDLYYCDEMQSRHLWQYDRSSGLYTCDGCLGQVSKDSLRRVTNTVPS